MPGCFYFLCFLNKIWRLGIVIEPICLFIKNGSFYIVTGQLTDFHNAIRDNTVVSVPVEAGLKALELAYLIEEKIKLS